MQGVLAIEHPNVLGLHRRQPAHCPGQQNKVRFGGLIAWKHPALPWEAVAFSGITTRTRRDYVVPSVGSPSGEGNEVITRETLTKLELARTPSTILTPVSVSCEQERVRNLPTEFPRHMDEPDKPDYRGSRKRDGRASHQPPSVSFDYLGLSVENQPEGPPHRDERQGFERRVKSQTAQGKAPG